MKILIPEVKIGISMLITTLLAHDFGMTKYELRQKTSTLPMK